MWGTRSSVAHRGQSEGLERAEVSPVHPDQSLGMRLIEGRGTRTALSLKKGS